MGKKLLIVHAEPEYRIVISALLRRKGYETIVTGNFGEAIDILSQKNESEAVFDLVIADPVYPGLPGCEFIKKLIKKSGSTPVCVVASTCDQSYIFELLQSGCRGYLNKPFVPNRLIDFVCEMLELPP